MDLKRTKPSITRTRTTQPAVSREALIEELLDLLEPDIAWNEDVNPRPTQHAKDCIKVFRKIRPKKT